MNHLVKNIALIVMATSFTNIALANGNAHGHAASNYLLGDGMTNQSGVGNQSGTINGQALGSPNAQQGVTNFQQQLKIGDTTSIQNYNKQSFSGSQVQGGTGGAPNIANTMSSEAAASNLNVNSSDSSSH